jgi:hypothetical protein
MRLLDGLIDRGIEAEIVRANDQPLHGQKGRQTALRPCVLRDALFERSSA